MMKCQSAQTWLLQTDSFHPKSWPANLAKHVRRCSVCGQMLADLQELEDAWRNQPTPEECESAKASFLQQLPALEANVKPPPRRWLPVLTRARLVFAAGLLVGVGLFGWLVQPAETRASSDLVERLVDWNIALTNADPTERQRLIAEQETLFREELQKEELSEDDREIAEQFFENGRKMAAVPPDPLAEADQFNKLAGNLLAQTEKLEKKGNTQAADRNIWCSSKLREHGFNPNMARVVINQKLFEAKKGHFEHIIKNDEQMQKQFEKMQEHAPDRGRPAYRKGLDAWRKPPVRGHPPQWHKK